MSTGQASGEEKKSTSGGSSETKPNALSAWDTIKQSLSGKKLAIFLDYDGTLTPIVADPAEAKMTAEMREVIRSLARRHDTAIVTGRRADTIQGFVQLSDLYYAASHGFDIIGPGGKQVKAVAAQYLPAIKDFHAAVAAKIAGIRGALLEDNIYCVTLHYRNVADEDVPKLEAIFDEAFAPHKDNFVKRTGKKVWEARPAIDWDKGKAVTWLLENIFVPKEEGGATVPVTPLYFGDDMTDEDAFRVLTGKAQGAPAFTFFVRGRAGVHRDTEATYVLDTVAEVQEFLSKLITL